MSARSFLTPDNSMQIWTPAAGWYSARRGRSVTGERGGHKMNKDCGEEGSLLHLEDAKLRWSFSGKARKSGRRSDPIKARRILAPVLGLPGASSGQGCPSGFIYRGSRG